MIAFDADVLTQLLHGSPHVIQRAARFPADQQAIPVVVADEILRGRLNTVRQAEAGRARVSISRAYSLLRSTIQHLHHFQILEYHDAAEQLFQSWRQERIRVATHDMRIAATCVVHSATLVSRNRRDFDLIPSLSVEYWD
jgi:tRNA(fMet)-specific endonuclease VapC